MMQISCDIYQQQNGTVQSVLELVYFVFFFVHKHEGSDRVLINVVLVPLSDCSDCIISFFQELSEKLLDAESSRVALNNEVIQSLFPLLPK